MIKIASLERKNGKITVNISVTRFSDPSCRKRIKLMTPEVINFLKETGVKDLGRCIKKDKINNFKNKNSGIWIFEAIPKVKKVAPTIKKVSPVKKKGPQARKKPKKVEKTLDKSPEDVIIEVEKKETLTSSKTQTVTEE